MKKCNRCLIEKETTEFFKDKKCVGGFYTICKSCKNSSTRKWREENKESYNKMARDWRSKNIERNRWYNTQRAIKTTYGISLDEYHRMFKDQDGKCAICKGEEGRSRRGKLMTLCIDHCHTSKKVRGLLCSDCNSALGYFKDNTQHIQKAIAYLEKHGS